MYRTVCLRLKCHLVLLPVFTFFKTILDFFLLFFFVCFLSTQTLEELLSLLLLIFVLLMPFGGIFQQKFLIFTAHFKNTTHSIGHQLFSLLYIVVVAIKFCDLFVLRTVLCL
jgi:hypothetical protein